MVQTYKIEGILYSKSFSNNLFQSLVEETLFVYRVNYDFYK